MHEQMEFTMKDIFAKAKNIIEPMLAQREVGLTLEHIEKKRESGNITQIPSDDFDLILTQ